jgi:hypothetical protein
VLIFGLGKRGTWNGMANWIGGIDRVSEIMTLGSREWFTFFSGRQ